MLASACWSSANTTRWSKRWSQRFCIPHITHKTATDERRLILERFREGRYLRLVTGRVLNEGVDIPDCGVAIIVSGNATGPQYIQRLVWCCVPKRRARCSTSWSPKAPPRSASPTADGHRNVPGLERRRVESIRELKALGTKLRGCSVAMFAHRV